MEFSVYKTYNNTQFKMFCKGDDVDEEETFNRSLLYITI